jgi:hypothetical protein
MLNLLLHIVWNGLKKYFSRGEFIRNSEWQIEIYGLKHGSQPILELFTSLKVLWNCPRILHECSQHIGFESRPCGSNRNE